jgi:hypothetical protein
MTATRPHLATTRATDSRCHSCNAYTLVGLVEGLQVRVNAQPVAFVGPLGGAAPAELDVLLAGGRLYVRNALGELNERTEEQYRHPTLYGNVHAEHSCGVQQAISRRAM